MQNNYRFIGIRPFETEESNFFFERENYIDIIFKSIYFNKISVVHSEAGVGKTSIIKAGVLPKLISNSKFNTFYFSIPNFIKGSNFSPSELIINKINDSLPKFSYLDKIIEPENNLWYKLKRLEETDDKETVIVLDQFENIFSFSETEIVKFKDELVNALFDQIPNQYREKINNKISDNPNLLTPKGLEKLYKTLNLKLLIISRSDKLFKLNFFKDKIHNIDKNLILIDQIDKEQAKNILQKTAVFKTKYNVDNNFISEPFSFSDKLLDEIIDFLTKNDTIQIETYQLQIIGREIELISIQKLLNFIDISEISDFEGLYNDYYEGVVNKITDSMQRISARKFIEDELIFEYEHRKLTIYEGLAKAKYNLSAETLDLLINNNLISIIKNDNEEIFYEISHDALITPILMAKDKRIKYEIRIEQELLQNKFLREKAETERKKAQKNKKISLLFSILFLFASILGIIAIHQRNVSIKNEKKANSSLYASVAFKLMETDPTLCFRYAQKAFEFDNQNSIAGSAILHSFYKSNIFYSLNINTAIKADDAIISDDCSKILLVTNSDAQNLFLTLINSKGEVLNIIPQPKLMSSMNFSKDGNFIIVSYYNHATNVFDLKGKIINSYNSEEQGYTLFANLSDDNSKVVTCNSNNNAQVWSFDGKLLQTLKGHFDEIKYADFSPDGSLIATIGQDAKVIIFDLNGKIVAQYTYLLEYEFQSNDFQPVKFFPDGNKILFVVNDNLHFNYQIIVWDFKQNKIVTKLNNFGAFINNVNFINSNTILVSTKDNKAIIIDLNENSYRLLLGNTDWVFDAKIDKSKSTVYTISKDKTIKTWKIFDPNKKFDHLKNKQIIKLSNSGSYFASYNGDLAVFSLAGDTIFYKSNVIASNIIFSQNDDYLISFNNKTVYVNEIRTKIEHKFTLKDTVLNISFAENEKMLKIICKNNFYTTSFDGKISSSQKLPIIANYGDFGNDFISITNKEKFISLNSANRIISEQKVYNIQNVKIASKNSDCSIFYIPKTIYFSNNQFKAFDKIKTENKISAIEISNSGNLFCFGDSEGNCFVYAISGKLIYHFYLSGQVLDIQFSPNEKTIFVQYFDKFYTKIFKQFVIDPSEIINYIDNLKLYGNVYKPTKLDVEF